MLHIALIQIRFAEQPAVAAGESAARPVTSYLGCWPASSTGSGGGSPRADNEEVNVINQRALPTPCCPPGGPACELRLEMHHETKNDAENEGDDEESNMPRLEGTSVQLFQRHVDLHMRESMRGSRLSVRIEQ